VQSLAFGSLARPNPKILLNSGVTSAHGKLLVNLLGEDHTRANESGKHRIMLEGYGYRWYRVGGLDYLLRRTDIDQSDTDAG
jgi:maltose alpha-D-glucosyltransferase / alpha-amylase